MKMHVQSSCSKFKVTQSLGYQQLIRAAKDHEIHIENLALFLILKHSIIVLLETFLPNSTHLNCYEVKSTRSRFESNQVLRLYRPHTLSSACWTKSRNELVVSPLCAGQGRCSGKAALELANKITILIGTSLCKHSTLSFYWNPQSHVT